MAEDSLLRVDVSTSDQLADVVASLKELDGKLSDQIGMQTRRFGAGRDWQQAIDARVKGHLQQKVLGDTATVLPAAANLTLQAGNASGRLQGGRADGSSTFSGLARVLEFGTDRDKVSAYMVRGKVRHRHASRAMPYARPKGNVVYPAAQKVIPGIVSLWVQTAVRTIAEALEGKYS